jgi:hypothetical protein
MRGPATLLESHSFGQFILSGVEVAENPLSENFDSDDKS